MNAEVISGRVHGGDGRRKSLILRVLILIWCVYPVDFGGRFAGGMPKGISSYAWGDCREAEGGGSGGDFEPSGERSGAGAMVLESAGGIRIATREAARGKGETETPRQVCMGTVYFLDMWGGKSIFGGYECDNDAQDTLVLEKGSGRVSGAF